MIVRKYLIYLFQARKSVVLKSINFLRGMEKMREKGRGKYFKIIKFGYYNYDINQA